MWSTMPSTLLKILVDIVEQTTWKFPDGDLVSEIGSPLISGKIGSLELITAAERTSMDAKVVKLLIFL